MEVLRKLTQEQEKTVEEYILKYPLEFYWDYREKLNDKEKIDKLLDSEESLIDLETELLEYNVDYIFELEMEYCNDLKEEFEFLQDWDKVDIIDYFDIAVDMKIDKLLENTEVVLRVELSSNYEGISYTDDPEESEYLKEVLPLLEPYIDKKELERELINILSHCNVFTFVFKTTLDKVVGIREKIKKAKAIKIDNNVIFGLFDRAYGSGSIMEMNLKNDIVIPVKDGCWGKTKYDSVDVYLDDGSDYGFQSVFGVDSYYIPEGKIEIIERG